MDFFIPLTFQWEKLSVGALLLAEAVPVKNAIITKMHNAEYMTRFIMLTVLPFLQQSFLICCLTFHTCCTHRFHDITLGNEINQNRRYHHNHRSCHS